MNQLNICLLACIIYCKIPNIIIIRRKETNTCMSFRYIIYSCKLSRHICNHFLAEHMCLHLYNLHKLKSFHYYSSRAVTHHLKEVGVFSTEIKSLFFTKISLYIHWMKCTVLYPFNKCLNGRPTGRFRSINNCSTRINTRRNLR